jgi:hypothetical protein
VNRPALLTFKDRHIGERMPSRSQHAPQPFEVLFPILDIVPAGKKHQVICHVGIDPSDV